MFLKYAGFFQKPVDIIRNFITSTLMFVSWPKQVRIEMTGNSKTTSQKTRSAAQAEIFGANRHRIFVRLSGRRAIRRLTVGPGILVAAIAIDAHGSTSDCRTSRAASPRPLQSSTPTTPPTGQPLGAGC
jgi:hypothetical protein